jgi:polysaccharide biosynthesis transport protein
MNTIIKVVLVALGLGVLCAAITGPAVYFLIGTRYTAYSVLHVSMQQEKIFENGAPVIDRDRFEIFKNTQQESLVARMVLLAAIRKPEVKDIPIVQYKTQYGDPVEWLAGKLSISFPGNAELMMVSLSLDDPKQAQSLLKAVVESYMTDVVLADNEKKKRRFDELDRICGEKEQEIRNRREELKGLVNQAGGSETPDLLSARQKLVLEELAIYTAEKAKNEFEIAKLKGVLAGQKALLKAIDTAPADPGELEILANSDPRARELSMKLASEQPDQPHDKTVGKRGATTPSGQAKTLQAQYDARVKELSQKVREKQHAAVMRKMIELEPQLNNMEEVQVATAQKITKLAEEAKTFGQTSVDIQMVQAKLKNLDQVLATFVTERERLGVEIGSAPRIAVAEAACEPLVPSNTLMRVTLTGVAMLVTFCCVVAVVILWCTLSRRKKTADG